MSEKDWKRGFKDGMFLMAVFSLLAYVIGKILSL